MRIRGLEMLVFPKILRTYLMDDPLRKGDTPTFVDNKGELWGSALFYKRQRFLFTYIVLT